ncbi:MAG: hypothetical protein JNM27_14540 [Leptospirales bacterium]|nr:hypothetical protein [Leptospirales bacterium]
MRAISVQISVVSLCLIISAGCAAFNRKNTPLIGLVEKNLVPKTMPAKALTAPLYIPIGLVGGMLDVFVIHPLMETPAAWKDMVDLLWTGDAGYVTAMGSLPVRAAVSPLMLVIDVLARSAFDFHRNEGESDESGQKTTLAELVSKGDLQKIEDHIAINEIPRNENALLLKVFEISLKRDSLRQMAVARLGNYMDLNETWLIAQLGKNNQDDQIIANAFASSQSKNGGRALLKQLATRELPAETAAHYVQIIFSINDPELTGALLRRIRTGRE